MAGDSGRAPPGLSLAGVIGPVSLSEGFAVHALSFDYGQRHRYELEAARRVAAALGVTQHRIATIDLRIFGGSALTDVAWRSAASIRTSDLVALL